jgi:hypothetical protein
MNRLEFQFLAAAEQLVELRLPLARELADQLGVRPEELFYLWAERRCKQRGFVQLKKWKYFFHGYECDFRHVSDGSLLRLDFGPRGNLETLTSWGIAQFTMSSKVPGQGFLELQKHLAKHAPPYDEYSGSLEVAAHLSDTLEQEGFIARVAPDLTAIAARHTTVDATGISTLRLSEGTPDRMYFDVSVANRMILTQFGKDLVRNHIGRF